MAEPVLRLRALSRRYGQQGALILNHLDLSVERGQRVAIMGASGSGKSTLLHLAAGMDQPDHGQVEVLGQVLSALPEPARTHFRARHIGLIFQDFNLIDSLTVTENIALPLWLNKQAIDAARIGAMADTLGIGPLLQRLPETLSGGEKQRVAIARALIHEPALLLADEPTGSLDPTTAERVMDWFDGITHERGCTLLMVTHNAAAAALCDRTLHLQKGQLVEA
jgi:putative ABC transport system ATP-binding protein